MSNIFGADCQDAGREIKKKKRNKVKSKKSRGPKKIYGSKKMRKFFLFCQGLEKILKLRNSIMMRYFNRYPE